MAATNPSVPLHAMTAEALKARLEQLRAEAAETARALEDKRVMPAVEALRRVLDTDDDALALVARLSGAQRGRLVDALTAAGVRT